MKSYRAVEVFELGISDAIETLFFDNAKGTASKISDAGNSIINVTTLDKHINGRTAFIKMDLEGWELRALAGAKNHIVQDHPALAICVYHHPSHFWSVFDFVMGLRSDYKVFLRHYTEGLDETVMYFVPD